MRCSYVFVCGALRSPDEFVCGNRADSTKIPVTASTLFIHTVSSLLESRRQRAQRYHCFGLELRAAIALTVVPLGISAAACGPQRSARRQHAACAAQSQRRATHTAQQQFAAPQRKRAAFRQRRRAARGSCKSIPRPQATERRRARPLLIVAAGDGDCARAIRQGSRWPRLPARDRAPARRQRWRIERTSAVCKCIAWQWGSTMRCVRTGAARDRRARCRCTPAAPTRRINSARCSLPSGAVNACRSQRS